MVDKTKYKRVTVDLPHRNYNAIMKLIKDEKLETFTVGKMCKFRLMMWTDFLLSAKTSGEEKKSCKRK